MKRFSVSAALLLMVLAGLPAAGAQQPAFGPAKYEVKERYGKDNIYRETFRSPDGPSLIKIQNGTQPSERPDFIDVSVNSVKLLRDGVYGHPYFACFLTLKKENILELNLKDQIPSAMKRPLVTPKFLIITVLPGPPRFSDGIFGINSWEGLKDFIGAVQKIKEPGSASLALNAANLQHEASHRAEAMRKLSDRGDVSVRDFFILVYRDVWALPDLRAEAAFALGKLEERSSIPLLANGLLDTDERIRLGAARALSRFREEDTRETLTNMLERLDPMRRTAVIRAIVDAGWKPVGTLMDMAGSSDPSPANVAIELLGHMKDPRVPDLLLRLLANPRQRSIGVIITALGETRDRRAVEPLLALAKDPKKRKGKEAQLGLALANLGDMRAAKVIKDMAKKVETGTDYLALQEAYKKLTGKDL